MSDLHREVRVYLDSNVFIDLVEGEANIAELPRKLFAAAEGKAGVFVTSEITLAEVLAPSRESGAVPPHFQRRYLDIIVWNNAMRLLPVSRRILYETATLRRYTRHKLVDAIHCVTAIHAGCQYLMSRDRDMKRLPMDTEYLNTDATGVATLIEALRG